MSNPNAQPSELEIKLSFLERLVEQLNGVVTEQANTVDDLARRLVLLERAARSGEGNQEPLRPHDDPPPHY
ncbi:MAG: SlyX family protein [Planctomycetota bacterium]|nr:SlyX family protein [Planctomycetota bacterium]